MLNQITLACYTQGHQNQFINSETWCVQELYCSMLKELNTGKVVKANINIRDNWGDLLEYYESYTDVISIRNLFDFLSYVKLDKQGKKRMQLEAIHNGMMQIADAEKWEKQPLIDAYNNCLEKNLEYQCFVGTAKSSPDKRHKINFWCNWDIDIFEVYSVLYDKNNNEIERKKIIEKSSYDGEFIHYVKWKWLDNTKVLLEDKYKYGNNEKWEIGIDPVIFS